VARAAYRWLGSNAYETVETGTYLYDGWNNIRELTHSQTHTLTNSYIWGLDLSGTLQGAGGIGGLLAASLGGTTSVSSVFFAYDGNGNVTDLVDTNGALVAHYEFDPFGRMVAAEGDEASSNPFRFSTKHWDDATGLGYWGYRWYEPESGRWTSKDRIAEMGGRNLYRYVGNAIMNAIDVLGLIQLSDPPTDDELRKLRAILLKDLVAKEYKGTPESAKAMTHFLEGSGETYDFGYDFFADSSAGKRALKENQDRVKQAIKDFLLHELRDGKSKRLLEYWDRQESSGLWEMEADFYTAVKGFTLTTYLAGTGVRTKGGCFTFTGVVDHLFWDYYDFNQGTKFPWGEEIGTLPCDYLILMNERKMASNMWTQGEGSQSVKAQGKDKLLWRYNFEIIFGGVNDGSGGAKDEVIKKYPKAKRMAKIPRPKGRRDL
jgi:RHS repeat-associated protein